MGSPLCNNVSDLTRLIFLPSMSCGSDALLFETFLLYHCQLMQTYGVKRLLAKRTQRSIDKRI